jgi:hypothetical protein
MANDVFMRMSREVGKTRFAIGFLSTLMSELEQSVVYRGHKLPACERVVHVQARQLAAYGYGQLIVAFREAKADACPFTKRV